MAVTRAGTTPAIIESGRILDVDMETYTVTAVTQFTKKPQTGIQFATPYQHFNNGEGIYFMPEVGSLCWICFPSDGQRPFVLAWAPAGDDGNYRSMKQDLNPGDIYLGTRDGNAIWLRRGGVIQIGATPLAQRLYLPLNNAIQDFCENYATHSIAGDLEWVVQRDENAQTGDRPTTFKLNAKQFANDPNYIASLEIGSHDGDANTILTWKIYDKGGSGQAVQFDLGIDNQGNVKITCQGDVTWNIQGSYTQKVQGSYDMESKGSATVKSTTGSVTVEGKTGVTITGDSGPVAIKGAPNVTLDPIVIVGGGALPVALAPPLLTWLASHTHMVVVGPPAVPPAGAGVPLPTLPPTIPPPPVIAATALIAK